MQHKFTTTVSLHSNILCVCVCVCVCIRIMVDIGICVQIHAKMGVYEGVRLGECQMFLTLSFPLVFKM